MGFGEFSRRATRAGVLMLVLAPMRVVAATPGDAFVCYTARPSDGEPKFHPRTVTVTDERETRQVYATKPRQICLPADLGDGVLDAQTALLGYKAKFSKELPEYDPGIGVQVLNQLGELYVDVQTTPALLLVPTATDPSTDPAPPDPDVHGVDHYRCHQAQPEDGATFSLTQQVAIESGASSPTTFELTKVRTVCEPVGRLPNFVTVDFYNIGDVFAVVDELNGVE